MRKHWREWHDWQRVLVYWKVVHDSHGFSVQALAHICKRPAEVIWAEINTRGSRTGGCYCNELQTPVVVIRASMVTLLDGAQKQEFGPNAWCGSEDALFDVKGKEVKGKIAQSIEQYPWPKYSQVTVWDFSWGGMENTGATTLNMRALHKPGVRPDYSADGLVAHELAHQWFGDLITCRTMNHIWLNEGFATYFTDLWIEHHEGADDFGSDGRDGQVVASGATLHRCSRASNVYLLRRCLSKS